jgi:hypothetical protein
MEIISVIQVLLKMSVTMPGDIREDLSHSPTGARSSGVSSNNNRRATVDDNSGHTFQKAARKDYRSFHQNKR